MSSLPKFQKIITDDYSINQLQNNIQKVTDTLAIQPLVTGNRLEGVSLAVGTNTIFHQLKAPLQGWLTTRIRGSSVSLYDAQDTNPTPSKTLILISSAAVVVDLVVF